MTYFVDIELTPTNFIMYRTEEWNLTKAFHLLHKIEIILERALPNFHFQREMLLQLRDHVFHHLSPSEKHQILVEAAKNSSNALLQFCLDQNVYPNPGALDQAVLVGNAVGAKLLIYRGAHCMLSFTLS